MGRRHRQAVERQQKKSNAMLFTIIGIAAVITGFFIVFQIFNQPSAIDRGQATQPIAQGAPAVMEGDVQVIRMAVDSIDYLPATFTVKEGIPVKWVVDGTKASGCTRYLISQQLGVSQRINPGENIIEFLPDKKGTYKFSCSMNMATGTIQVV